MSGVRTPSHSRPAVRMRAPVSCGRMLAWAVWQGGRMAGAGRRIMGGEVRDIRPPATSKPAKEPKDGGQYFEVLKGGAVPECGHQNMAPPRPSPIMP